MTTLYQHQALARENISAVAACSAANGGMARLSEIVICPVSIMKYMVWNGGNRSKREKQEQCY